MQNFEFLSPTKIIFGRGSEIQVGQQAKALGNKILLHYGGGSIKASGLYDRVISSLEEEGLEMIELGGVVSNPRVSLVREGIRLCRENGIEAILAVGGGSVIDSAKAISAGVHYNGDVWELTDDSSVIKDALPIGTVLTIAAAGSETSGGAVITNEGLLLKKAFGHISLKPRFSILNPELTMTLPAYQTACGIADMMAHVMERYFTREPNVAVTDGLCESLMRTITEKGPQLMKSLQDYDLRAEIMWAGTLAHNGILGTGRADDWASHDIEHEISAIYDIAHGAGLTIVFPAWMKYVYKTDIARFARWANRVFDIPVNTFDLEATALAGIQALEEFFESLQLPTRLSDIDLTTDKAMEMAKEATKNDSNRIGSFRPLSAADICHIFDLAK